MKDYSDNGTIEILLKSEDSFIELDSYQTVLNNSICINRLVKDGTKIYERDR